jgi:hypothetical protein
VKRGDFNGGLTPQQQSPAAQPREGFAGGAFDALRHSGDGPVARLELSEIGIARQFDEGKGHVLSRVG